MASGVLVSDRRDLANYYENVCSRSYSRLRGNQRLEPQQNLLKSYMIEAHPEPTDDGLGALHLLQTSLGSVGAEVLPTDDPTLFNLRKGSEILHVDAFDDRFWILHSVAHSSLSDRFVYDLTKGSSKFDVAWYSSDRMEEIAAQTQFLGFSSDYDPRPFLSEPRDLGEEEGELELPIKRLQGLSLSLRRFSGDVREALSTLRKLDVLGSELGIATMRLRFGTNGGDEFALDEVTNRGKFTARGPSFSAHRALISQVLGLYQSVVTGLEQEAAITWSGHGDSIGHHVSGLPVGIRFDAYPDWGKFLTVLFNGRPPFRLWGLPVRQAGDHYSVQSVDLHIGSTLRFDAANGMLRVYLPAESCGNTITRLYANIQEHVDTRAQLVVGEETRQFGFAS